MWYFTVERDTLRRWAAALSDPATRTAATTPTSRSNRQLGRLLFLHPTSAS